MIARWRKGVAIQGALDYNEPPDWYYTLRESLGYACLAQGQYPQAEQVFSADLKNNRGSGRSLNGLKTSLEEQRKPVPARVTAQLAMAWRHATASAAPWRGPSQPSSSSSRIPPSSRTKTRRPIVPMKQYIRRQRAASARASSAPPQT